MGFLTQYLPHLPPKEPSMSKILLFKNYSKTNNGSHKAVSLLKNSAMEKFVPKMLVYQTKHSTPVQTGAITILLLEFTFQIVMKYVKNVVL